MLLFHKSFQQNLVEQGLVQQQTPYEANLRDLEQLIDGVDTDKLKTLCCRLLYRVRVVFTLAKALLSEHGGENPPPVGGSEGWCRCRRCKSMPQPIENLCCGREICITHMKYSP